ncbi:glycine cleavage system aminomethyltransferase GcvT [Microcella indica]|uniref:glycine cleavage system aminomethyltransferase GcvT n=1 Tax=Microcella indica TaxID=2750620 RepID=UPI0015CF613E|nr:glycine cleavage system aminomethyltransferase GcvT [Microcella indica]
MQRSPLHDEHAALGATFTGFAGWQMPVRYSSDLAEHAAVRTAAGLFDLSHMAEISVTGADAGAFLDVALAGRLSALPLLKAKYSLLLDESGGIIDDLIVYASAEAEYLVVANASNRHAVVEALLARQADFEVQLADLTEQLALIAVQGPAARAILDHTEGLATRDELSRGRTLDTLGYYAAMGMAWRDSPVFVARTGYTGEDGFELYVDASDAVALWRALLAAGEAHGLMPCGLAARDTLRLEAGMPLYGHELSRDILPEQAGLGRAVAVDKPRFVGKAAIEAGPAGDARVLVGLRAEGRRAPRAEYSVLHGEDAVGAVTSGALSPTLGYPIAMALVHPDHRAPGTVLDVDVRGTRVPATVVPLPFYRKED